MITIDNDHQFGGEKKSKKSIFGCDRIFYTLHRYSIFAG